MGALRADPPYAPDRNPKGVSIRQRGRRPVLATLRGFHRTGSNAQKRFPWGNLRWRGASRSWNALRGICRIGSNSQKQNPPEDLRWRGGVAVLECPRRYLPQTV